MNFIKRHKKILTPLALVCFFFLGIGLSFLSPNVYSRKDQQFSAFTNQLFTDQITSSTLNLHYTVANPSKLGIKAYPITFGKVDSITDSDIESLKKCQQVLSTFNKKQLSKKNQITYDLLNSYITTELSGKEFGLLNEMLSPTLGIQAQLPVLMAEYTFRTTKDIEDYLQLLSTTDTYFEDILKFQHQKAKHNLFMSNQAANNIITQCTSFIDSSSENYLITVFNKKIRDITNLSTQQKETYIAKHNKIVAADVIPAYEELIAGLKELMPLSKNPHGLYYYENGKRYYEYLIQSNTGVYDSIEAIRLRLLKQLTKDYKGMRELVLKDPSLIHQTDPTLGSTSSPKAMLEELKHAMTKDFPKLPEASYEIKQVDESLAKFLSPAFYLTPPIDDPSKNSIYVNQEAKLVGLNLYTTLAHEGFPGHLYQTLYFNQTNPDRVRHLFSNGGYVEGWATYIESYAYLYSTKGSDYGRIMWMNRSLNLNLCSLLDLGIHYYGWTPTQCAYFLKQFGISDITQVQGLYQNIVETPSNYLKYYLGYLNFEDLREASKAKLGKNFNLKEFHKKVLEIGPVPFPILKEYLDL